MKRQIILTTTLATTLFIAHVSALDLIAPTSNFFCNRLGFCGNAAQAQTNTQVQTNQSFFDRVFNNWRTGSDENINRFQTTQVNTNNNSNYNTVDRNINFTTGNNNTVPNRNDLGLSPLAGREKPLLSGEQIADRQKTLTEVIKNCSINASPDCVGKVLAENTKKSEEDKNKAKYDKDDESVDAPSQQLGPEIKYSDTKSAETPHLIPGTNQYSSQEFKPYTSGGGGPSVYTSASPIDVKAFCKSASGQGQLLNPNGANLTSVNKKLLGDATAASAAVGKPLTVVSGWRSQAQQDSICASGGTGAKACGSGGSRHTQGLALDVQFRGYTYEEKVKATLVFMAGGWSVGNYANDGHTHFGLDGGESMWRWFGVYPQDYKQKAFTEAAVNWASSKIHPRPGVAEGAKKALQRICQ